MDFDVSLFFSALGLAFILEACLYALFPGRMLRLLRTLAHMPESALRRYGMGGLLLGLVILCLARL